MARTKDYEWISDMCENEGIEERKVEKCSTYLFETYFKAKRARRFSELKKAVNNNDIIETEAKKTEEKKKMRHEYLLLMQGVKKVDQRKFVLAALSTSWIDEKIEMIINEIADLCDNGTLYRTILIETYLKEKPLKREELYRACGLGRTAYFDRRKEALLLFGILTYKYAHRREQEDGMNDDGGNEAEIIDGIGPGAAII